MMSTGTGGPRSILPTAGSWVVLFRLGIVALLGGWGGKPNTFGPPPPTVTVRHPIEQEVSNDAEFTGNPAPLASVEPRARVRGFLQSINFTPGSEAQRGDLPFVMEPEPSQVKVAQAQAEGIV